MGMLADSEGLIMTERIPYTVAIVMQRVQQRGGRTSAFASARFLCIRRRSSSSTAASGPISMSCSHQRNN